MKLDDLIIAWKKQDEEINQQLQNQTLKFLLKEKSQGVLSNIKSSLTVELTVMTVLCVLFNILFIVVKLPYTLVRIGSFVMFNVILLWYIYYYTKAIISMFTLNYSEDLRTNLENIIKDLNSFCNQYKLLNLPVVFLSIIIFAGSQHLFILLPWMIIEFLLWRALLVPKLMLRFEGYKSDLEYSLQNLQ